MHIDMRPPAGAAEQWAPPTAGVRNGQHVAIVLLGVAYWMLNNPYAGIQHDGVIYALLAANWLEPTRYANELFLAFGSQDDFSLFSPLYGTLIRWLGLDTAARTIVVAGGMLWVASSLVLAKSMFRPVWLVALAVLFCATIKFSYSPNFSTFRFNENFATARSLAMPLAVFSLAALVAGRRWPALVLGLVSSAFHPLLGVWAVLLSFAAWLTSRQFLCAVGGGLVLLFAGSLLLPVAALKPMDPSWAAMVRHSSIDVFMGDWNTLRWPEMLLTIGVLWLAGRHGSVRLRDFFLRVVLLTVIALLGAKLCSDGWPIRIVMQVQPWRVLWLAELVAVFALLDLVGVAAVLGRRYLTALLGLLLLAWGLPWLCPWLPYVGLAVLAQPGLRRRLEQGMNWLAEHGAVAWAIAAGMVLMMLPNYWISLHLLAPTLAPMMTSGGLQEFPVAAGFLLAGGEGVFFLILALGIHRGRWQKATLAASLAFLLAAGAAWDARDRVTRLMEGDYLSEATSSWTARLPIRSGETVLWPGKFLETWLVLKTSSYASKEQAVGIVFSRQRMEEIRRRLERVSIAALPPGIDLLDHEAALTAVQRKLAASGHHVQNLHRYGLEAPDRAAIPYLCQDPALDWIVSRWPEAGGLAGRRFDPGPRYGGVQMLHDCRRLRRGTPGLGT